MMKLNILTFRSSASVQSSNPASQLLNQILEIPHVSQVSKNHCGRLVRELVTKEAEALYGNSWSYLIQAADCRMWGADHSYGYRYFDGTRMAMIGLFRRPHRQSGALHFHVIRPMGNWTLSALENLCESLYAISKQPVYIKKLTPQQRDKFSSGKFRSGSELPWLTNAPLEDDTYPEVVIDLQQTLALLNSGDNELRRKFRRFENDYGSTCSRVDYSPALFSEAITVVNDFFATGKEFSRPENYFNLLETLPSGIQGRDYFSSLYRIGERPAAIFVADCISPGVAGVYANLTASKDQKRLSEYLLLSEFQRMSNAGIQIVNLGGSETKGLDEFKNKFRPASKTQMHWLIYG